LLVALLTGLPVLVFSAGCGTRRSVNERWCAVLDGALVACAGRSVGDGWQAVAEEDLPDQLPAAAHADLVEDGGEVLLDGVGRDR
jgi:hypothetical protein